MSRWDRWQILRFDVWGNFLVHILPLQEVRHGFFRSAGDLIHEEGVLAVVANVDGLRSESGSTAELDGCGISILVVV